MQDHILVLNAGSSSLKFSTFQRAQSEHWHLGARGQIEGIGTAPRLSVKNAQGGTLADEKLDAAVRDAEAAIEVLAGWLRSNYGDARLLGVGHRIVHGGTRFSRPTLVNRGILVT